MSNLLRWIARPFRVLFHKNIPRIPHKDIENLRHSVATATSFQPNVWVNAKVLETLIAQAHAYQTLVGFYNEEKEKRLPSCSTKVA